MKFLDEAKIYIRSGAGGHGCLSFRREKFIEFGGPDGGNGGDGGNVIAIAVDNLNTLIDYRFQQHIKAKNGRPGEGKNRTGANGEDAIVKLPVGTEILDESRTHVIADLTEAGQQVTLAEGGRGGRGNTVFKSSTNRAPRRADPGEPAEELTLWLRLKLIADAGLIGLPNAGKSTFLAAVTRARPKIADYPFTTLHPNLGVVHTGDGEYVLADIPGLIAGAHDGAGLGDRFLGHIERCGALVHLIDGTGEDVVAAYRTVRQELEAYDAGLPDKPELVCLNKCDALTDEMIGERRTALAEACSGEVLTISGIAGLGVDDLLNRLGALIRAARDTGDAVPGNTADSDAVHDAPSASNDGWQP